MGKGDSPRRRFGLASMGTVFTISVVVTGCSSAAGHGNTADGGSNPATTASAPNQSTAPGRPTTPQVTGHALPPQALIAYQLTCTQSDGAVVSLPSSDYAWDAGSHTYKPYEPSGANPDLVPAPDGSRIAVQDPASGDWAVSGWADALAGRAPLRPFPPGASPEKEEFPTLSWSTDGKTLITGPMFQLDTHNGSTTLQSTEVAFIDPGTGTTRHVPFPAPVSQLISGSHGAAWTLRGWTGDTPATVQFILLSSKRDTVEWLDASGAVVKSLKLQSPVTLPGSSALPSPSARYLAFRNIAAYEVYDVADGKRLSGVSEQPAAQVMESVVWDAGDDLLFIPDGQHLERLSPAGATVASMSIPLPSGASKSACQVAGTVFGAATAFPGAAAP